MPKAKTYKDEEILSALILCGSVKSAAQKVGCSVRLIFERMQDEDFSHRLSAFRAERIRNAALLLDDAVAKAVMALVEILENSTDYSAADRIRAASLVLDASPKFAERLAAVEGSTRAAGQKISLDFGYNEHDVWSGMDDELTDR